MSDWEQVFILGAACGVGGVALISVFGRRIVRELAHHSLTVRRRLDASDRALVRRISIAINNPLSAMLNLAKTNLLFLLMLSAIYVIGFFRNTIVKAFTLAGLSNTWGNFIDVAARCCTGIIVIFLLWFIFHELRFFARLQRVALDTYNKEVEGE